MIKLNNIRIMKTIDSKLKSRNAKLLIAAIFSFAVLICCLMVFLILGLSLDSSSGVVITRSSIVDNEAVDSTKLNLPEWAKWLILVSIAFVIIVFAIGIICFSVYIIGYFWNRRFGKTFATVEGIEETKIEEEETPNLVKLTIGEKVAEDGQQQQ